MLGYKEIWITCAFYSSMIDKEETLDRVVVVDTRTMDWRWGPRMDIGRGACMGFKLQYNGYELICSLGGSVGAHNEAIMVQHTSCYDRVREIWIQLPREPVALDHGNVQVGIHYSLYHVLACPLTTLSNYTPPPPTVLSIVGRGQN
jgi:hypothetical protein